MSGRLLMEKSKILRSLAASAVFSALLCIASPFSLNIGAIPISLATFLVYLSAVVLGTKMGGASVVTYILLGALGLPVFAGFSAGAGILVGPTGGYIVGYIPCALIVGFASDKVCRSKKIRVPAIIAAMLVGTAVLYLFGTAWYIFLTGVGVKKAVLTCVVPFIAGDCVKIAAASLLGTAVREAMRRAVK